MTLTFQGHVTSSVGYVTIRFPVGCFLLMVLWNQASISNAFRDIQRRIWRMVDMTLNDLYAKVKVIVLHYGTNRFLVRLRIGINSIFALGRTV